jgi:DNA-binding LacI/PurR family transcriptional regulator
MHAMTVAMHLMNRGKRIPKDVSVLSRDHDHLLDATSPTIAHYAIQPGQFAGRIALAVRQLADTNTMPSDPIRLMPAFVQGASI